MKAADGISSVIVSEHSDAARHTATLSVYRTTLWLWSGKNSALQRWHIKNHDVWGPERLLSHNVKRTGCPYASYFHPKIWMVALDKGRVTYCEPHSLRRYYGSRLLYAGVPEGPRGGLDGPQQHGRAPGALPRHL